MDGNNKIQIFEDRKIRTAWNEEMVSKIKLRVVNGDGTNHIQVTNFVLFLKLLYKIYY